MSGRAMASRFTTSRQAAYSDRSERRNLRRAGTRANNCSTRMRVPGGRAAGPSPSSRPLSTMRDQPSAPRTRLSTVSRATLAIDGRASPRKPRVVDRLDLVAGQLGGGVALERERHVGRAHAAAVVGHLDPRRAAAAERDRDPRRAGVDRIFDQLLQRAGRSFHHFTGGDAVDQMLGQAAY